VPSNVRNEIKKKIPSKCLRLVVINLNIIAMFATKKASYFLKETVQKAIPACTLTTFSTR
jgi:hypothetical protein